MSCALDAIWVQGVNILHATGHKRQFKILNGPRAGLTFVGTLRVEPSFDLATELGSDRREKCFLDTLIDVTVLESQDRIQEGSFAGNVWVGEQTWKLVTREANNADVENRYEVMKVTTVDT